jgi:hypothetical protein
MIFLRTVVHCVLLVDFGRAESPEMTAVETAANLELLGVPVAMLMISTQRYEE